MSFYDEVGLAPRKSVLFLWSNPVTGMGISTRECYARASIFGDDTTHLIAIEPEGEATYGAYISIDKGWVTPDSVLAPTTDFVLHVRIKGGVIAWAEWVLQNPAAVSRVIYRPTELKSIVTPYLSAHEGMKTAEWDWHNSQEHFVPGNYRTLLAPYVSTPTLIECVLGSTFCQKALSLAERPER